MHFIIVVFTLIMQRPEKIEKPKRKVRKGVNTDGVDSEMKLVELKKQVCKFVSKVE